MRVMDRDCIIVAFLEVDLQIVRVVSNTVRIVHRENFTQIKIA
jgi:hypothetical protein